MGFSDIFAVLSVWTMLAFISSGPVSHLGGFEDAQGDWRCWVGMGESCPLTVGTVLRLVWFLPVITLIALITAMTLFLGFIWAAAVWVLSIKLAGG